MVDRVALGHHSQGRIPAIRKMAPAAGVVAGGLRAVTLPALTTANTAAMAAVLAADTRRRLRNRGRGSSKGIDHSGQSSWSADAPARIQAVTSPRLVIAGQRRAGSGPAGGGWTPARPHRCCPAGQPPGVGERTAEQEFDLGVGAAQLVAGPSGQGVVDGGVQPQQDALALGHRGSVAAVIGRGCRC